MSKIHMVINGLKVKGFFSSKNEKPLLFRHLVHKHILNIVYSISLTRYYAIKTFIIYCGYCCM